MKDFFDLTPKKQKTISPKAYLDMTPREKSNIETCRFAPPTIGSSSFGKFVLTLKQPVYSFEHGQAE